jgi:hypothetical protein
MQDGHMRMRDLKQLKNMTKLRNTKQLKKGESESKLEVQEPRFRPKPLSCAEYAVRNANIVHACRVI